jgi:hypothetical protein
MKTHSTNYQNTFIAIADDCPTKVAEVPPTKGTEKTAANLQFEMLYEHPYEFTSDEVIFQVFAHKQGITQSERQEAWKQFFSKGQPCLRSSPLTKRYGWGVHSDAEGKVAIFPAESEEYKRFASDATLGQTCAMRSKRA